MLSGLRSQIMWAEPTQLQMLSGLQSQIRWSNSNSQIRWPMHVNVNERAPNSNWELMASIITMLASMGSDEHKEHEQKEPIQLQIEKHTGETCTCSLCLDDIEDGCDIHRLLCGHSFHASKCMGDKNIQNWVDEHGTCPYCRSNVH